MGKRFVAGLGLCSRPITPKRIQTYDFLIKKYNLEVEEMTDEWLDFVVDCWESIKSSFQGTGKV